MHTHVCVCVFVCVCVCVCICVCVCLCVCVCVCVCVCWFLYHYTKISSLILASSQCPPFCCQYPHKHVCFHTFSYRVVCWWREKMEETEDFLSKVLPWVLLAGLGAIHAAWTIATHLGPWYNV